MNKFLLLTMTLMILMSTLCIAESDTVWVKKIGTEVKAVKFNPDGQFIYAAAIGRKPMKLSTETGEILKEYDGVTYVDVNDRSNLDISNGGKFLYSGDEGNTMYVWDTETGALIHTLNTEYEEKEKPYYKSISVSGKYVAALVAYQKLIDGNLTYTTETHIWDVNTREKIKILASFGGHTIKFSPDGKYLAFVKSENGTIFLKTETWEIYYDFIGHEVFDISFTNDASLFASCGSGGHIRIWDIPNKSLKDTIVDYGNLGAVAFAGNDYVIFQGSMGINPFYTKIWDTKSKNLIKSTLTYPPKDIDVFKQNDIYFIAEAIGNYSILLLKFDPSVVSVPTESDFDLSVTLSLNNATSSSNLIINSDKEMIVSLEVYDINSKTIFTKPILNLNIGRNEINIKTEFLPVGVYFCRISSKNIFKTFKIMLEK
ncbi:MAG: T9SS type A sorting domain-containing protein [Candidatus Kapabacteria bacterium]|nr:T9SS type A sorting domain-containing protein [Candidatus Kapabacteria bacterium]